MSKIIVGLLNYGAGNSSSVRNTILKLGFRSRLINKPEDIKGVAALLIPGVGAFPAAMKSLSELELIEPIQEFSHQGNAVIGVCLGMQLLADASHELAYTRGLELIPGEVKPIGKPEWHIGWNTLEVIQQEDIASTSDGRSFYFNHAYEFEAPPEYVVAVSRVERPVVSMVKKNNICGFQFHPEKSQLDGLRLMGKAIKELCDA